MFFTQPPKYITPYSKFKNTFTYEQRINESIIIRNKYPDRIPVICEKNIYGNNPDIDKHKYLIPIDFTIGNFLFVIRKRIKLQSYEALFILIKDIIPLLTLNFEELYYKYKDSDGYLYITYSKENTFG